MGSSVHLFGMQRTVHQILGGGFCKLLILLLIWVWEFMVFCVVVVAADVILWRRKDVTFGILIGTLAAWFLFELSGYTLLSFVSNVLLLLSSILFVWAKSAEILNRLPPPIPEMHISEEIMSEATAFVCSRTNAILSISHDIALGKDTELFYIVAMCLLLLSFIESFTDFLTFSYTSLVILLALPVLYEKYEDSIDRYLMLVLVKMHMYERIYAECFNKAREWIVEKMKEC